MLLSQCQFDRLRTLPYALEGRKRRLFHFHRQDTAQRQPWLDLEGCRIALEVKKVAAIERHQISSQIRCR